MSLPSIDQWLNLEDWHFDLTVEKGQYLGHHWLYVKELVGADLSNTLALPSTFCLLATQYDGARAGYMYADRGWMMVSNYALSPPLSWLPELYCEADYALMIVDKQTNRSELEPALFGFQDHFGKPTSNPNFENFCKVVTTVDAYLYLSCSHAQPSGFFLIARSENLLENFLQSEIVLGAEKRERAKLHSYRQTLWRALGPECGPNSCSESGCERLQTADCSQCFLHHNTDLLL